VQGALVRMSDQLLNVRLDHQSVRESTLKIAILQIGIYNIEFHAYEKEH
jgi:hypothetical protein